MASHPGGGKPRGSVGEMRQVQLDGSVALKIIKHCQDEGSGSEWVTRRGVPCGRGHRRHALSQ